MLYTEAYFQIFFSIFRLIIAPLSQDGHYRKMRAQQMERKIANCDWEEILQLGHGTVKASNSRNISISIGESNGRNVNNTRNASNSRGPATVITSGPKKRPQQQECQQQQWCQQQATARMKAGTNNSTSISRNFCRANNSWVFADIHEKFVRRAKNLSKGNKKTKNCPFLSDIFQSVQ